MTKRIKRQFWLSPEENAELKRKAKLSGINETSVIRILIRGYDQKKNRTQDFMKRCGSFVPSATTSISLRSKQMHSALLMHLC